MEMKSHLSYFNKSNSNIEKSNEDLYGVFGDALDESWPFRRIRVCAHLLIYRLSHRHLASVS